MMDCQKAGELVSQQLDHPLPLRQKIAVRFHLLMCAVCRAVVKQLEIIQKLSNTIGDTSPRSLVAGSGVIEQSLSHDAKERMKTALSRGDSV